MPEDYYKTLGLAKGASAEEIKRAYRAQALKYHPDRNKDAGATDKFKQVSEAYHVLSNPKSRSAYDKYGHSGVSREGSPFGGFDFRFGGFDGLGDIFESFFGGSQRGRGPKKGADIAANVTLELHEVLKGAEKSIKLQHRTACKQCFGSGAKKGSGTTVCVVCAGHGRVERTQRAIFGQFRQVTACDRCAGTGEVISDPCQQCQGSGRTLSAEQIKLSIPPGVESGNRLRLEGRGEAGERGAQPGDLLVNIKVKRDKRFQRDGKHLKVNYAINVAEAALGAEMEVQTLDGTAKLTVKPGTGHGASTRLRGHGLPPLNGGPRGDLIVTFRVDMPTSLTGQQRELFERLKPTLKPGGPHKPGLFSRVRDAILGD